MTSPPRPPEKMTAEGALLTLYPDGPAWEGAASAAIGDVSFRDPAAGAALLERALARLAEMGCTRVLGPMAGDTWHSYRFVCDTDGSPPFLLEPQNRPEERGAFHAAGFQPVSRYFSARMALADAALNPPPPTADFRIETWDGTDPEALFGQVHALSTAAFAGNAFYKPIAEADFLAMYMPVVPMMRRELIFFARRPDGTLAGFLFAIPNYAEGLQTKTVILKTYASLARGAGRHLVQACTRAALDLGFDTIIHALIHETNISAERSATEGGVIFRRYELLGRRLDG